METTSLQDLLEEFSLIKRDTLKMNDDSNNEKTYLYEDELLFCMFGSDFI